MPTALAISPHLDDAVFSAGGTLARLARQGWRVIVATVFTVSVPDPQGFALACQLDKGFAADIDYMALRRDEDAAACAVIGAEALWLPFVEAPHRGYQSAAELFAGLRGDDSIVCEIAPALSDLMQRFDPTEIFAPQAIGAHVDHVAVTRALLSRDLPLRLWADFPYVTRPASQASPLAHALDGCSEQTVGLDRAELNVKARAVAAYTSQLGFQFGGAELADAAMKSAGGTEIFLLSPSSGPVWLVAT